MAAACPDEFVQFAGELAEASGGVLRRHFRTPIPVESKADATPVTIADREAEEALRAAIAARFPDHGVVGEEFPPHAPDADLVWGARRGWAGRSLRGSGGRRRRGQSGCRRSAPRR